MARSSVSIPVTKTKLLPQTTRRKLVHRRQLLERIERGLQNRLIVVCAPAGFGKSSLLSSAFSDLRRREPSVGWLSLDHDDNDIARFLAHFIAAIRENNPRFAPVTFALLETGRHIPHTLLRTTLLNDLSALEGDAYLFLDDLHLIADRQVHDLIDALLLAPLPRFHLVIATRDALALPLGRLRVTAHIEEVGVHDLRFSIHETKEFLEIDAGAALPPHEFSLLYERTEGWVAGLQLASIAAQSATDREQFFTSFSGEHKSVADFLSNEVYKRQDSGVKRFLLTTSILTRFNAELCNAVTGSRDGRQMLNKLEAANLFIFSLDGNENWYRYHHLFSDFLRRRLREEYPDSEQEFHTKACDWLAEHNLLTDAIGHAFASGDIQRAGHLLDLGSDQLYATGHISTLDAYASKLPRSLQSALPHLQLNQAFDAIVCWRFDEAREKLDAVKRSLTHEKLSRSVFRPEVTELQQLRDTLAHREMLLTLFRDDIPMALKRSQEWLSTNAVSDPFMQGSARNTYLIANREQYTFDDTTAATSEIRKLCLQASAFYGNVFLDSTSGATHFMQGATGLAEESYVRSRHAAVELHGERSSLTTMPSMLLAELYYEQNRLVDARSLLETCFPPTEQLGFVDNLIAAYITQSRIEFLDGAYSFAEETLDNASRLADRYGFVRLHANVIHERIRQLVANARTKEAVRQTRDSRFASYFGNLSPSADVTTRQELFALAYARACLETNAVDSAVRVLKAWFNFTRDRGARRSSVRLGVLLSRALCQAGDRRSAQRYLFEALRLGQPGGFVRSFLDEGKIVTSLLAEMLEAGQVLEVPVRDHLSLLVEAATAGLAPIVASDTLPREVNQPVEPVTQREVQIIKLAGDSLPNSEIASALGLSESTVKWYWQRIFEKLEVRRRSQAIKKARHIGLL